MSNDPNDEITAMSQIAEAVKGLDGEAIKRVIAWAAAHYGLPVAAAGAPKGKKSDAITVETAHSATEFADVADLYDAASPKTGAERALVLGFWLQKIQGEQDFDGLRVNSELKNLGHQVSNITVAFNALKEGKTRLAMQVKKSGTSKKARKRYKLTVEGIRKVERMIRKEDTQEEE